ncbi:hypothetical protein DFH06DRAFT_1375546 [Mycena polygramma]|nr:hypothetical protein DFH06DRAFT_1375546 [Mycena polygramma]
MDPLASAPAFAPATNPVQSAQEHMMQLHNARRSMEQNILTLMHALSEARKKGDRQAMENLMPHWTNETTAYMQLKHTLHALQQRAAYLVMIQGQATQAQAQGHMGQPGQQGQGQRGQGLPQAQPGYAQGPPGQMLQQEEDHIQMTRPRYYSEAEIAAAESILQIHCGSADRGSPA